MKLEQYLRDNKITQSEFATLAGLSQTVISTYVRGTGTPRLKNLKKIINATNGNVTMDDLLNIEVN